jgi:hypothetical protein
VKAPRTAPTTPTAAVRPRAGVEKTELDPLVPPAADATLFQRSVSAPSNTIRVRTYAEVAAPAALPTAPVAEPRIPPEAEPEAPLAADALAPEAMDAMLDIMEEALPDIADIDMEALPDMADMDMEAESLPDAAEALAPEAEDDPEQAY